jgi:hypothetical protein
MLTNKQEWNKRHGFKLDEDHSKAEIGRISNVPPYIVDEVVDRGYAAHRTNPASVRLKGSFVKKADAPLSARLTPMQWAYSRLYSFVNKLEGRRALNHDHDLAKKFSI